MIDYARLLEAARAAMRCSYSPYSKFQVGAAALTESGTVVTGCNIENVALGPTICAERVAVFGAIARGEPKIVAVAIAASSGKTCPPCGTCRQVLWELAQGAKIVMESGDGSFVVKDPKELLPLAFGPESL